MRIASVAIGLFCAAFLVHWLVWRIHVPRRQSAAILLILLAMLPLGLAVMAFVPPGQAWTPRGVWEYLHVAIFHVAMTLAYVVAYSALEDRSPSMTILVHVANAKGAGRTREELVAILKGRRPVERRFEALVRDNMVEEVDGVYRLTSKGKQWAWTFLQWRRLLKMDKGG
ncbi:MAG: hypothetical protein ABFD16_08795 [Thermoguttaceae bacterium]|jgi:hypothetical protein